MWGELRYRNAGLWVDQDGRQFNPKQHYYVGGNTKVYGAVLFRMRERDFGDVNHVDGVSPAWPLSYADFEPWYTKAEQLYSVHGERGADPLEPWASAPYPWPAVSHEPRIEQLAHDLKGAGCDRSRCRSASCSTRSGRRPAPASAAPAVTASPAS